MNAPIIRLFGLVVVLFAGGSYVSTKNTLVQKNEDVDRAYSQVNVVQQRRLDLIPNLVATVKGYAAHEAGTLDAVIQARNAAVSAGNSA